jgi:hypothetical protein
MKLAKAIRKAGKLVRSVLQPIGNIKDHLGQLTQKTARECGFNPEIVRQLEESAKETCRETGLSFRGKESR